MKALEAGQPRPLSGNAGLVLNRLRKLAASEGHALDVLPRMMVRTMPARSELICYRQGIGSVLALQSGWAAHVELLDDGRRQFVQLVLPGEIIAYPNPGRSLASSTVVSLTPVEVASWQLDGEPWSLKAQMAALGASDEAERRCMINQVVRIGRRSAYERLAHLLLEIRERLIFSSVSTDHEFPLPLTQEIIADALGLTSVHINRTLQLLRQEGHLELRGGVMELQEVRRLMRIVDYRPLFPVPSH